MINQMVRMLIRYLDMKCNKIAEADSSPSPMIPQRSIYLKTSLTNQHLPLKAPYQSLLFKAIERSGFGKAFSVWSAKVA